MHAIASNCREDKDKYKDKYKDNDKDEYKDNDKDNDNGKLPAEEKGVAWEGVSVVGEDIDGMSGDGVSCKSLSEKGISCKSLSDNGVFENRSSDNGGFENRLSDNGVSAENMSENGVSEERMSENGGFVKSLPNNGVSAWRMSENGGYADNLSENEMSVGGPSVGGGSVRGRSTSGISVGEGSVQGRSASGLSVEGVVELYHGICRSYPQVLNISEKRKASIKECLKVYSPEDFTKMFSKAENSSFLKGANDHNWSATFDWFMDETNFTKILEGQFDNKAPRASPEKPRNGRYVPNPLRDTSGDMETSMAILEAEMEKMRGGEAAFG